MLHLILITVTLGTEQTLESPFVSKEVAIHTTIDTQTTTTGNNPTSSKKDKDKESSKMVLINTLKYCEKIA